MKSFLVRLLILILLPVLASAANTSIKIEGVRPEITKNIEVRLSEWSQNKPLIASDEEDLINQIRKAIEPFGYFKPKIHFERKKELIIQIDPGPPLLIKNISIILKGEGSADPFIKKAIKGFPIKNNHPLNSKEYEEAKQSLLNAAEHQGYLHNFFEKAEILTNIEQSTAEISLILNTGPQFYFGQIQFDPTYISPEILKRYIPFHVGEPYSIDRILTFESQLESSGYFKNVSIKPLIDQKSQIPIQVHLQRASRINYSFGLGYGTDTSVRGRFGYHVIPLNRSGHKLNIVALGSIRENSLQGQYIIPGKNPLTDQYSLTTNLSHLNYNSGSSNSVLTSLRQQHLTTNFQRNLSINALYERFSYSQNPLFEKDTFFPKLSLTWLNTSNQLFSPSGYNLTINGLASSRRLLSDVSFSQAWLNFKGALWIDPLRTRLYFHSIQGITSIKDINQMPLSLAFLLGGSDNLKAFSYNSLGPGKILTYNGLEIQKELLKRWYLVGFLEKGNVYNQKPAQLKNDLGLGLMWVSPIGPIKIGVAQAFNSPFNRSSDSPKLVISMGPDL